VGDWRDRLPTGLIVVVIVVAVVAVTGATLLATGRSGSLALSLPKADPASPEMSSDATPSTTSAGPLLVHAAGAVVHPGVVQVPQGARVADVVVAAGGPTGNADLEQINLAERVTDGERVYVPRQGEAGSVLASSGGAASSGAAVSKGADTIVNLNEASEIELETLPGVGPATAQAILDYRTEHGRFRSVDDLLNVRGIGPSKLEQIKPHARV